MRDFVSDVARRHEPVRRDLSLYSEIPLLHVRHARICIECVEDSTCRIVHVLVQHKWERNSAREIAIWAVQTARRIDDGNLSSPRWSLSGGQVQFDRVDVVEDSIAGANHHLSIFGWVIDESNARPEVFPLFAHSRVA